MTDIVNPVTHLPSLARSAQNGNYNILRALTGFGRRHRRSFSVAGSDAWNSHPRVIRCIVVLSTFKRRLKAELFSRAYDVSLDIADGLGLRLQSSADIVLLLVLYCIFLHC